MRAFLFLLSYLTIEVNSERILCYFPDPTKSHILLALPIVEELSRRGHELTVVTSTHFGLVGEHINEVVVETRGLYGAVWDIMSTGKMGNDPKVFFEVIQQFTDVNIGTLKSERFQQILNEGSFDLVFFSTIFFNNYQLGIADHFKAPWVTISAMGNVYSTRDFLGTNSFASTVPTRFATYTPHMNFWQRSANFFGVIVDTLMSKYMEYEEERLYAELWPADKYRTFSEMKKNVSLVFLNGHWSESKKVRPMLPNEIELSGIQINSKPLDPEIKNFLDEATDGLILWTFGATLPVSNIESDKLELMFKVLSTLKQKVILKWELDDTTTLPKNFLGRKWLAQDSILAHTNVKLFITHGGLGGTTEAMYHKVPILSIPFFADQEANVVKAIADGWCLGRKVFDLTEENFSEMISDLLNNKSYQAKVDELGSIYRDRLATPLDEAVFWVEYVLKHHGAPHLSYSGQSLNIIQMYSLDVIAIFILVLYGSYKICRKVLSFIFRKVLNIFVSKEKQN